MHIMCNLAGKEGRVLEDWVKAANGMYASATVRELNCSRCWLKEVFKEILEGITFSVVLILDSQYITAYQTIIHLSLEWKFK